MPSPPPLLRALRSVFAVAVMLASPAASASAPPPPATLPIYFGPSVAVEVTAKQPAHLRFAARAGASVKLGTHRDGKGTITLELYQIVARGRRWKWITQASGDGDVVLPATLKAAGDFAVKVATAAPGTAALTVSLSCAGDGNANANANSCARAPQPGEPCRPATACDAGLSCIPEKGCDGAGRCVIRPRFCPRGIACQNSCGCDGKSYCTPCEAARAGIAIAHAGACGPEATATETCRVDADCKGALPRICQHCLDGKERCAHWTCGAGHCALEICR